MSKDLTSGWASSPYGDAYLTWSSQGDLLSLSFPENPSDPICYHQEAEKWIQRILKGEKIPCHLQGTPFQVKVWKALKTIPSSHTVSYEAIAILIGHTKAVRAVANAIAKNNISWVIPCHRVVPKHGRHVGNYRWGVHRKEALLYGEKNNKITSL